MKPLARNRPFDGSGLWFGLRSGLPFHPHGSGSTVQQWVVFNPQDDEFFACWTCCCRSKRSQNQQQCQGQTLQDRFATLPDSSDFCHARHRFRDLISPELALAQQPAPTRWIQLFSWNQQGNAWRVRAHQFRCMQSFRLIQPDPLLCCPPGLAQGHVRRCNQRQGRGLKRWLW